MHIIRNNAESMRKFMAEMRNLAQNLDESLKKTEQEIENLSQTWRDPEFKEFKNKFDEDKSKIKPLSDKINDLESNNLRHKEEKLRKHLGIN